MRNLYFWTGSYRKFLVPFTLSARCGLRATRTRSDTPTGHTSTLILVAPLKPLIQRSGDPALTPDKRKPRASGQHKETTFSTKERHLDHRVPSSTLSPPPLKERAALPAMSAWLAARKLLLDRIAAAEARELSEQEFQRPAEVQSDATLNVHPASSSNTPAASVVATSAAASMIATSDIVASSTIWACTTSNASSVTAATSAAETVTSETIEEAAVSLWSANDESNFDTSANRSRRWRHQNVLKARDQNVNGQVRRKQREQQEPGPEAAGAETRAGTRMS